MTGTAAQWNAAIDRIVAIGPRAAICEDEVAAGGTLVAPGEAPWFKREDWPDDVVVVRRGRDIRLVLIHARQPGTGAFRRLVQGIEDAGLRPVVVEPMVNMEEILKRWGWHAQRVGKGLQGQWQWRPPRRPAA